MVCVKRKRGPKGFRERNIHHRNTTKALFQNFGAAKHFFPKNLEGGSKSTKYTNIQSEYVGNLEKSKMLEERTTAYEMRYQFVIPALIYVYASAVKDSWGNHVATGVYLLYHWSKVSLRVVAQSQRYSYANYNKDKDRISCDCTNERFLNSSDPTLIKKVKEKHEALDGLEQGGITYLNIFLDEMLNMSDAITNSLQEFFKNFVQDDIDNYPSENVALLVQKIIS